MKTPFDKLPNKTDTHICLLQSRGLKFSDEKLASHYLQIIGYYRLRGYFIPFQIKGDSHHTFLENTKFDTILEHYKFDSELRLLTLSGLGQIEIALKAILSDVMCLKYGETWYIESQFFSYDHSFAHLDYLFNLRDDVQTHKKTQFLSHYYEKYGEPEFPPSWMTFQILSFGCVSKIFKNLKTEHQKSIAKHFGFDHILLESWFESLTVTRNICAHHARLYNLAFSRIPKIADEHKQLISKPGKFYAQAIIIRAMLKVINPNSSWHFKLRNLFEEYPSIPLEWLGFTPNWTNEAFWN